MKPGTVEIVYTNPSFNGAPIDLSEIQQGLYNFRVSSGEKTSLINLIKK